VPSRRLDPDAAPAWVLPGEFGPVGSIVVTPLPGHGVPAGALVLLRNGDRQSFSEQEELFARLFAARAGTAMSAARVFALQASITDTLMRELLPPALEQLGGSSSPAGTARHSTASGSAATSTTCTRRSTATPRSRWPCSATSAARASTPPC
jgi:hypothetical protein